MHPYRTHTCGEIRQSHPHDRFINNFVIDQILSEERIITP